MDVAAFINGTSEPLENVDFSEVEVTIYPGENKILLTDIFKFHIHSNKNLFSYYSWFVEYEEGDCKANGEKFFIYVIALINVEMEWFNQPGHPSGTIVKPICLDDFKPYPPEDTNPEITIIGMGQIKEQGNSPKPIRATKLQFAKMKQYPAKNVSKLISQN